jgi:hypothetical protein
MNSYIERQISYEEGKVSGKNSAIEWICEEIEEILDKCAHDNGEMICRVLGELICKCREELV